jgi:hypothetical protein
MIPRWFLRRAASITNGANQLVPTVSSRAQPVEKSGVLANEGTSAVFNA